MVVGGGGPLDARIDALRADTPGTLNVVHLNNAGSSLPPQVVLDTQLDYLKREAEIGGYEAAGEAKEQLDGVYVSVAKLLNAKREEIALVENATVGWQMAFYAFPLQAGDRVLTSEAEYAANYVAFLHRKQRDGIVVDVIPSNETGETSLEALENMIDERVKLVAISHMPTNGGLINPAAAIGEVASRHGIAYLLDACQSAGQLPLDVEALNCDFLSATGRKYLRGPRGSGFVYVSDKWISKLHPPVIDLFSAKWVGRDEYRLREDAGRFENWENNYAARAGLGVAVEYALDLGLENIWQRVQFLGGALRDRLSDIPGVVLHDIGREKSGIVTFAVEDRDSQMVKSYLTGEGINVSVSLPDSTLLDALARKLPPLVRASVHYYNTEEELDRLCAALMHLT